MPDRAAATKTNAYLMMKAGTLMGRSIDEVLTSADLTVRQFLLMHIVAEARSESQLEVSRQLHLDPSLVVGLVDELETRGLMERQRHADDRRRYVLTLTKAGAEALRTAVARTATAESAFLDPLSAADRRTLQRLLESVVGPKLDNL